MLSRHELNRRFFKLNFVSYTTSLFGLGLFLDLIENDFIRMSGLGRLGQNPVQRDGVDGWGGGGMS